MLKDIYSKFQKDYLRIIIAVSNALLAASMIISPEPHNHFFWATLVFRLSSIPIAVFVGNKGLWFLYFIFANIKALDITYNNFTCVAIIMVLFAFTPKVNKRQAIAMAALYITDVFIVAGLHQKSSFYIYTHFVLCIQYCTAMWKMKVDSKTENTKVLIVTEEEFDILEKLDEGDTIKSIDGYSEATVYRKLTDIRKRNNIEDNKELKRLYKSRKLTDC